jgi:hypothetical protein
MIQVRMSELNKEKKTMGYKINEGLKLAFYFSYS